MMDANKEVTIEQSLCLSCGLCCDGTLFGKVPLKSDDDLLPLQKAGIEILTKGTKINFKQPCAAYRENCCQVYADRPTNCRKYRCELLKKYESGKITREEARQKINRVRELENLLRTEIARILPDENRMSISAILKITPEHQELIADPLLVKKWGTAMMNLSALLDYLQTHFQPPRKTKN